jgi:hypothetical protein
LPLEPPFYFEDMTTRVFPLRASLAALQNFVNRYLNIIPREVGRFRAVLPYAYLMMIDYGRLALQVTNQGWLSQHEIMFSVPVAWYRVEGERWVFQGWAWVTPFILVDSQISLSLGRHVIGWPKLFAELSPTVPGWIRDPRAPTRVATLSTMVFPEVYAGQKQERRVLLEVDQRAPISPLLLPPDRASPFTPWAAMSNAAAAMAGLTRDYAELLTSLGSGTGDPENLRRALAELTRVADPLRQDLSFDTLNLKQFRDANNPRNYCYQALTSAEMRVIALNAGGLLGGMSTLAGDAGGGYSLRLYRWPTLPIIETLGLEVTRQWRGDSVDVAELTPVLPFWYDVDMMYARGENVVWRTLDAVWHDPREGRSYPPRDDDATARLYNTTLGTSETVAGPFQFMNTTVRVLPLLAEKKRLRAFLESYLNGPLRSAGERFEPWCSPDDADPYAYVYLLATSHDDISSRTNDIGRWVSEEVTFLIPVKWMEQDGSRWGLRGVGAVPVFSFVDSNTAASSRTEVVGIPTTQGCFVSPPGVWMKNPAPAARPSLLRITTEVLPALDLGQKAVQRVVLEIDAGELALACEPAIARAAAEQWGALVGDEDARKRRTREGFGRELSNARALSREVLTNGVAWSAYTMKQFRDAHRPEDACYQSIVRVPHRLDRLHELREIEEPLHVRIHRVPTLPMVDMLGLQATLAHDRDGGAVHLLRPVRPFWLRMAWTEQLGERMWHRSGSEAWKKGPPLGSFLAGPRERRLGGEGMTVGCAAQALEAIDPQMIIESILAREE